MDRNPSSYSLPMSVACASVAGDKKPEEPRPFRSLKRVVSGAALETLLAGETGQPKHASLKNEEFSKFTVKEITRDEDTIVKSVIQHLTSTFLRTPVNVTTADGYLGVAFSVRDRLLQRWNQTVEFHDAIGAKRVYYMSLEFLIGRTLDNALLALKLKPEYAGSLKQLGFSMEDILDEERDAALGNGGLGRLAACYVDSLACKNYPGWGYGLRYKYGMFQQQIINGYQVEVPDCWLDTPNAWEFPRPDVSYKVRFYGHLERQPEDNDRLKWEGGVTYDAMAFDVPVPGYGTQNVGNIRLWSCKTNGLFDLNQFNAGNYHGAMSDQVGAELLTNVLYPNDNHNEGKELRLKQEYLFCSASLQDVVTRFKRTGKDWSEMPDFVAIQLNDTHPTLGVVELQRILLDDEGLSWDNAWDVVTRTFAFTNHTILPEAMEKWPVPLLDKILPRHMSIIYDINLYFLQQVENQFPGDRELLRRVSIIEESSPQMVRMAFLACVASHHVNGVAKIHSDIIRRTIFSDFARIFGADRFVNKTNGVSPRRWIHGCNPRLSELITESVGSEDWVNDMSLVTCLEDRVNDDDFRCRWWDAKQANKDRFARYVQSTCGIRISPLALFDMQVKRIHEYKRQLMNILYVIHRYLHLKALPAERRASEVPRVVVFAGKAASGYYIAKLTIKLITAVSDVINSDPDIGDMLKVVFIPDYGVTVAENIIPASDISQHISTAGTEASGTSNMKFVMNGGLIVGTVDGANIEIAEEIGDDQIFLFGCLAHEVDDFRFNLRYHAPQLPPQLNNVFTAIRSGTFGDPNIFTPLIGSITSSDHYLLSIDFPSYLEAQKAVDNLYKQRAEWITRSILCTARMSHFSSDRSIQDYAEHIWNIEPHPVPTA